MRRQHPRERLLAQRHIEHVVVDREFERHPAIETFGQRPDERSVKALLDLVYLTPGADNCDFLAELRLQNLEGLDREVLVQLAQTSRSPKLRRAVKLIERLIEEEGGQVS